MKKIFKIGIIGYGNIGIKRHKAINALKKIKYKIIFICDKKFDKPINKIFFRDINKIYKFKIDILIVAIPDNQTTKINLKKFKNLKCIIYEKPISKNFAYTKNITNHCIKNRILLKTGYNLRFDKAIENAKKLLDKNKLGKIYFVKINYSNGTSLSNKNTLGSFYDIGSHSVNLIDFFIKLNGNEKYNHFSQKNEFMNRKLDDNGFLTIIKKNILINIHYGFCSWKNSFNFEIFGSKGFIKIKSLPKWGSQEMSFGKRVFPSGKPIIKIWKFDKDLSFNNEVRQVFNLILKKKFDLQITNEGLNTLKLLKNYEKQ